MVMEREHVPLTERTRERVATRFRALGEPTRLRILERLFDSAASVNEIIEAVGSTQANVSKHLALLHSSGLVTRRKEGTRCYYAIADPTLRRICSIVCADVEREARQSAEAILGPATRAARR
jgi:DNA-binding transcriptional ArsR family regulator